jgi:hypothetical protein
MGTLVGKTSMHLQQCGETASGFKFVQRDTPAIIVGPDTLLQGDGAKGP